MKQSKAKYLNLSAEILALLATTSFAFSAKADNPSHTQQLLSTRQCPQCDLTNAGLVFANLGGANLSGANLSGANLSRSNLQGADLRQANLTGTSLMGANLAGAKLDGANLAGADLRTAQLIGSSTEGANFDSALLQGAIGLTSTAGSAEEFYQWGLNDSRNKNFAGAIDNFTQAINRKPDLAQAYLGRSFARFQTGDVPGSLADSKTAEQLFTQQNNTQGTQIAQKFVKQLETPPKKEQSGSGVGSAVMGVVGTALQFLFMFKPF
jgi:uncharacterized protein YjbI with pentapeptide repeats